MALFIAAEGCGSDAPTSSDASVDAMSDAASDANPSSDVSVASACGDAGYSITVAGDGVTHTLRGNWSDPDAGAPTAYYLPACSRLFVIAGSDMPDGGTRFYFQIDSDDSPGPAAPQGSAVAIYVRADGTYFSSSPSYTQPTYTEVGAPGGVVSGSYAMTLSPDSDAASPLSLSGTFCALRQPDGPPTACPP
jgi:hypothetical protein